MVENAKIRKLLLVCGIVASLLFVVTDVLAGRLYSGYSFTTRSISELSAVGAPTRSLFLAVNLMFNALLIAFGLGIWACSRKNAVRVMAGVLLGNAVIGFVVVIFFPMHLGEAVSAIHLILMAVSALFLQMLTIVFGAAAFRNWFRFYSIGTLLTFLALTIFGLFIAPQIIPGPPQSGLQERVLAYGCLLWQAMLSIVLLRSEKGQGLIGGSDASNQARHMRMITIFNLNFTPLPSYNSTDS